MSGSHETTTNFVAEPPKRRVPKGYTKIANRIDYVDAGDKLLAAMAGRRFFTNRDVRRFNKFSTWSVRMLVGDLAKRGLIRAGGKREHAQTWTIVSPPTKPHPRGNKQTATRALTVLDVASKLSFISSLSAIGMNAEMLEAIRDDVVLADEIRKLVG